MYLKDKWDVQSNAEANINQVEGDQLDGRGVEKCNARKSKFSQWKLNYITFWDSKNELLLNKIKALQFIIAHQNITDNDFLLDLLYKNVNFLHSFSNWINILIWMENLVQFWRWEIFGEWDYTLQSI